jgi:hypothetical protein
MQIISAIPREWKLMIRTATVFHVVDRPLRPGSVMGAKKRYTASRYSTPAGQIRWYELHPPVKDWPWPEIWRLPLDLGMPNKYQNFQFKILHRILAAPSKLHIWGQRDSSECYACGAEVDTIEHMLISCQRSLEVWVDVIHRFEMLENISVHWTVSHLLFGFFHDNHTNVVRKRLNTIVLLAKYYIYTQRRVESFTFSAIQFQFALKRYLLTLVNGMLRNPVAK